MKRVVVGIDKAHGRVMGLIRPRYGSKKIPNIKTENGGVR